MVNVNRGLIAAFLAPIFIAISIILINQIGSNVDPFIITGFSQLISLVFLIPMVLVTKQYSGFKKLFTTLKMPFIEIVLIRAIAGSILLTMGITLTTGVKSILLLRLEPVFVFLLSMLLLKESPKMGKILLVLSLVVGSYFVVYPGSQITALNFGDILIILSILLFSYSYIPINKIARDVNPFALTIASNIFGGIAIVLLSLFILPLSSFVVPLNYLLLMIGSTLSFYVIGLSLFFYAFRTVKPWVISSLLSLETVSGLFLAVIVFGGEISNIQIVGTIVILISTYLIAQYQRVNS